MTLLADTKDEWSMSTTCTGRVEGRVEARRPPDVEARSRSRGNRVPDRSCVPVSLCLVVPGWTDVGVWGRDEHGSGGCGCPGSFSVSFRVPGPEAFGGTPMSCGVDGDSDSPFRFLSPTETHPGGTTGYSVFPPGMWNGHPSTARDGNATRHGVAGRSIESSV